MTVSRRWSLGVVVSLALMVAGCGGGGSGGNGGGGTPPPMSNRAPVFTAPGTATVAENTAGVFYTATATDADGNALTFSLSGGVDRNRFQITSAGGLSFVPAPDFEVPGDANRDNIYQIDLAVSDGMASATLSLSVTVTDIAETAYRVRRVAAGLNQPAFLAPVPDGSGRVFVVELGGRVLLLSPSAGTIAPMPFLDLTGQIATDGERGLLGFATAPDFRNSGTFYVFVTIPGGTIEIRRYRTMGGDRDRADPATGDAILSVPHPRSNHNGGWIGFGADNLLYIGIGDGGGSGDPDDNGQNPNTLLGKILRIDPSLDGYPADASRDYAIPANNPFATGGGAPEVLAYGLRNPFRNGFDPATGNLWIGDVGQGAVEEIDLLRPTDAGANYGWPILEGTHAYRGGSTDGLIPPVAEYLHGSGTRQGDTVIGGYVYRGPIEQLQGQYAFADFIVPNAWTIPVSRVTQGTTLASSEFVVRNADFAPNAGQFNNLVSFGVDEAGNLYLVDLDGEIFAIEPAS
ncbi:MAG TPA: PQQ-dependent sugar dehydrogenase [Pseudoxanthomonas sp.]|nr:PQQ-dependent sugar dehydrogenase [Pseudoxanthomonas sp.]